ncbi:PX domain-containing protein [Nannizzia gypsea CBS 118893]|uniref:Endosomal/vacuolar adapter protein YPT35 n=1 Tax=Arthroderma gypseum (strain ATCC MYA-4604 / CBS 118893) TaxID=535722 RepID=E4UYJ6_ARTGP|nr:PX domain-containing protein [Nannizzia gypsea CBS 118893]EFR02159.1 PX domain-containing protein [Nannizzia gypsea CBS 118893]
MEPAGSPRAQNAMLPQLRHVDSLGAETAPIPSAPRAGTPQSNPRTATPPYWRHSRNISHASHTSLDRSSGLITLEDHSEDPSCDTSKGLWAKNVTIDDYAIVKGQSGIGAYVVWICNIQTLEGASMVVRMRYSQFVDLRCKLAEAYPYCKKSLPALPPKSALFKFNAKFLEARRQGLAYFLNCVLLNPEFSGSPILKNTLFTHSA